MRLSAIVNVVSGTTVSSHSYQYDTLNGRTRAWLEDASVWVYDYNDRDELISAKRFWPDWTPTAGQQFGYAFRNIGNRTSTLEGGDANGAGLPRNWDFGVRLRDIANTASSAVVSSHSYL